MNAKGNKTMKGKTVFTLLALMFVIGCCPPPAYYTVIFNSNNGTGDIATQSFFISVKQALNLNTFTRTNYTFACWNTEADGSGTSYADGETVNNLAIANSSVVTLYAQWKSLSGSGGNTGGNTGSGGNGGSGNNGNSGNSGSDDTIYYYTVTFYDDYGNIIDMQTVQYGKTATKPTDPTKDGYIFDGWYYGGSKFDFSTPIRYDITLTARWSAIKNFVIELYASQLSEINLSNAAYGEAYTIQLLGSWTDEELQSLGSKIREIPDNRRITLDMTQTTDITTFPVKPDGSGSSIDGTFNGTFNRCTALIAVLLPSTLETISNYSFCYCYSLESVTIGNGVTNIGNSAFMYCKSLTSVIIPESVTTINWGTFYECTSLESVTIPDSVTSIGDRAFYNCSNLKEITYSGSKTDWERINFDSSTGLNGKTIKGKDGETWTHTGN